MSVTLSTYGAVFVTSTTPFIENFNSFSGTAATLPANFSVAGPDATYTNAVVTSGTTTYSSTGAGISSMNDNGSTADRAFGFRISQSGSKGGSLTVEFKNNTGIALTGYSLSYAVEQYSATDGNTSVTLQSSTNGTTFTDLGTAVAATGGANVFLADPVITNKSVNYTAAVAPGASVFFRFDWSGTSNASRPHIAVDNFSVTAIPEPASIGLAGMAAMGLLRRRRRA